MKKFLLSFCLIIGSASFLIAQEVLYEQNFEAANAGTEWALVQGDPTFAVGVYGDINNTTNMMVSKDVKQSIMALQGKEFEGPFTLEMESYPSFNFAGPIVNYVDDKNFVCVIVDNNDKRVRVRQVVDGVWDGKFPVGDGNEWRFWKDETYVSDSLGTDILAWGENKPNTVHWKIKVDPDEGTVTVYIDDKLILKDVPVVLPQYNAKIGVYTWWCRHGFDNIKVYGGITTSISKVIQIPALNIYPNPVSNGILNVDATFYNGRVNIDIYNLLGAKVFSVEENAGDKIRLNLNGMKKGMYVVKINNNQGSSQSQKLIVN